MFIQLQRKVATPTIESVTICYDEEPLQPPAPLDSYSGISETIGAILSAAGALETLLEEAITLDADQDILKVNRKSKDSKNGTLTNETDSYSVLANQDIGSLLADYDLDLPFSSPTAYELIVKENGSGFGFGYVGKEATILSSGDGTLFRLIQSRLTSDWSSLEPDQKIALTADIPARLAVLYSNPNDRAKYVPIATPIPHPKWLLPTLACLILRDLIKYPVHLSRLKAVKLNAVPYINRLIRQLHSDDSIEESCSPLTRAEIRTPLSIGFGKYFADLFMIHVCTEQSVLQHPRFLQSHNLPLSIDVRVMDTPPLRNVKGGTGKANVSGRVSNRRFGGTLSIADEPLFRNETVAAAEATGPKRAQETGRGKREKVKHLPILWVRVMGETRPIWLSR